MKKLLANILVFTIFFTFLYIFLPRLANGDEAFRDPRFAGFVPRKADGSIKRDMAELRRFQAHHPCPSTGRKTGKCPGWAVNHTWPLACGGADKEVNMWWVPSVAKACEAASCVDRYERKIVYLPVNPSTVPGFNTKGCKAALVLMPVS